MIQIISFSTTIFASLSVICFVSVKNGEGIFGYSDGEGRRLLKGDGNNTILFEFIFFLFPEKFESPLHWVYVTPVENHYCRYLSIL